jgi:hypothetical protein
MTHYQRQNFPSNLTPQAGKFPTTFNFDMEMAKKEEKNANNWYKAFKFAHGKRRQIFVLVE